MDDNYVPKRLMGKCLNGAERDAGHVKHAVKETSQFGRALCGAIPGGLKSAGWTTHDADAVTCKRCQNKLAKLRRPTVMKTFHDGSTPPQEISIDDAARELKDTYNTLRDATRALMGKAGVRSTYASYQLINAGEPTR